MCFFSFSWKHFLGKPFWPLKIFGFYVFVIFIVLIFLQVCVLFIFSWRTPFSSKILAILSHFLFLCIHRFYRFDIFTVCVFSLILDEDLLGWKTCPFLMFYSSVFIVFVVLIFNRCVLFLFRHFLMKTFLVENSVHFFFYVHIFFIVLIFLPINHVFTITSLLFILHIFSYLITYCLIYIVYIYKTGR